MQLSLALLNGLFIVPAVLAAPHTRTKRGEKPAGKVDPGTASDCTYWEEKTDASVREDGCFCVSYHDFKMGQVVAFYNAATRHCIIKDSWS
ncbi:hypothetical protein X797_012298 [Metarhizium robertsii]|uniref:Uncharacterized protein n=2 Tax=Metarhizium robertsii TaxID=568076 RepID=E9FDK2_METRA|nr:uncharacterized protein MAA_10351 [Metarhizium robertsii ARSEF 23]EFY94199.1 hypothetical protein MAA_10351 [Metarhizium robertsii ARSEF 23]EXU94630.1 hypothetical protein X797_012298 [Metarhizium robertsii]